MDRSCGNLAGEAAEVLVGTQDALDGEAEGIGGAGFGRGDGLEQLGLELLVSRNHRLPQLTTVRVPEDLPSGTDESTVRFELLQKYSIEIGSGVGPLAGKVWRIGVMGGTARPENVEFLLKALAEVLAR